MSLLVSPVLHCQASGTARMASVAGTVVALVRRPLRTELDTDTDDQLPALDMRDRNRAYLSLSNTDTSPACPALSRSGD